VLVADLADPHPQPAGDDFAASRALSGTSTPVDHPEAGFAGPALALADATARILTRRQGPAEPGWRCGMASQAASSHLTQAGKTCRSLCTDGQQRAGSQPRPAAIPPIPEGSGRRPIAMPRQVIRIMVNSTRMVGQLLGLSDHAATVVVASW
jgi:hypothetical protein